MKDMNKLINTILITVSAIVAVIFIGGVLKKNNQVEQRTDQSSMRESNPDDLTNKYIKELQGKLKQEEQESIKQIRKAQQTQPLAKPKDEDWRQVQAVENRAEIRQIDRSAAGASFGGTTINKDNAAEFIATARKNGYHVVLSPTYEVISITPIMNTQGINESFETNPAQ
jgi:surface antigen